MFPNPYASIGVTPPDIKSFAEVPRPRRGRPPGRGRGRGSGGGAARAPRERLEGDGEGHRDSASFDYPSPPPVYVVDDDDDAAEEDVKPVVDVFSLVEVKREPEPVPKSETEPAMGLAEDVVGAGADADAYELGLADDALPYNDASALPTPMPVRRGRGRPRGSKAKGTRGEPAVRGKECAIAPAPATGSGSGPTPTDTTDDPVPTAHADALSSSAPTPTPTRLPSRRARNPEPKRGVDPRADGPSTSGQGEIAPRIPSAPASSAPSREGSASVDAEAEAEANASANQDQDREQQAAAHSHHRARRGKASATLKPHGLPPIETNVDEKYVYLYFRFCAERHRMWRRRSEGVPRAELTTDECMRKTFVGNVFRELDPSGERHRRLLVEAGDQGVQEVCFRSFLFTGFYLEETWEALVRGLGETPNWANFKLEKYETILHEHHTVKGNNIYYGGFQMVPPKSQFGISMPSYSATLRMVKSMMEMGLPAKLAACRYAIGASELIRTIPTFGGFLSLCLLCFLQESPALQFYYRNYATCGPGSRGYLKRIFGEAPFRTSPKLQPAVEQAGLVWLYENQWRYWANIGEDPPHAWELGLRPGMRVLDIENALCWCTRYADTLAKHGYASLADRPIPKEDHEADVPAWCDEERYVDTASKPAYVGDYEEEAAKPPRITGANGGGGDGEGEGEGDAEDVYEVEKVVGRLGKRGERNGTFRVRWKGYPPEEDTWEPEASLREDSAEALQEWYEWEDGVYGTIERVRQECTYKRKASSVPSSVNPYLAKNRPRKQKEEEV